MSGVLEQRAQLSGKVAAVLGGGGGIGRSIALALAESGVDLALCDRDGAALATTREDVARLGRRVQAQVGDVTDPVFLDAFYAAVGAGFERLDIVVNVAGGVRRRRLMEMSREAIAADIQRNYGYVVQSVQRAASLMRRSGAGGSIVNFTTIEAHRGAAGFAVYAGAKAATANFTRAMAVELGPERIRLNCIAPDTTPSQGNIDAIAPESMAAMAMTTEAQRAAQMAMYIPLKAAPPPEALANAVLFLASDLAAHVTGTTLHVDGGTMAAAGFLDWPFGDGPMPVPWSGTLARLFAED
jgi:NAD(P)-dependent dehydrogenase (short-subunit alcohol dehydrogenase family)